MTDTRTPLPQAGILARRLDRLFATVRRPDGREYSYEEVARRIQGRGGSITGAFVGNLRRGVQTNAKLAYIWWLADAFFVDAAYLVTLDEEEATRHLTELEALMTAWATPIHQLAPRIDRLFALHRRPDGKEYTTQDVVEHIQARGGSLTAAGIAALRRDVPDRLAPRDLEEFAQDPRRIKELVKFFGVPISYLTAEEADAERILDQLWLLDALQRSDIQQLALRAGDLASGLRVLAELVGRSQQGRTEPSEPPDTQ